MIALNAAEMPSIDFPVMIPVPVVRMKKTNSGHRRPANNLAKRLFLQDQANHCNKSNEDCALSKDVVNDETEYSHCYSPFPSKSSINFRNFSSTSCLSIRRLMATTGTFVCCRTRSERSTEQKMTSHVLAEHVETSPQNASTSTSCFFAISSMLIRSMREEPHPKPHTV